MENENDMDGPMPILANLRLSGFPATDDNAAEVPIKYIRIAVVKHISEKLPEELNAFRRRLRPMDQYDAVDAVIHPLPPDTDFDLPPLSTIFDPISTSNSSPRKSYPTSSNLDLQTPVSNSSLEGLSSTPSITALRMPTSNSSLGESSPSPSKFDISNGKHGSTATAYDAVKAKYGSSISTTVIQEIARSRKPGVRSLLHYPARTLLRHNSKPYKARKPFCGIRRGNILAALLQTSGTRIARNSRCDNCTDSRGFWDTCVVPSWNMEFKFSNSCANCYYNGKAATCSFSYAPSEHLHATACAVYTFGVNITLYERLLVKGKKPDGNHSGFQRIQPDKISNITEPHDYAFTAAFEEIKLDVLLTANELLGIVRDTLRPLLLASPGLEPKLPSIDSLLGAAIVAENNRRQQ
ncbi:hypothetical protein F4677DRAFT_38216 [Hypoxylon crocopeplum]|nr:hypothetical protein F4677DRAFT_38216 [Hypoxylon crocopeplum]